MKTLAAILTLAISPAAFGQKECPMHAQHLAEVERRHDIAAVSHEVSAHKFVVTRDGGAIELRATDPADQKTVSAIRAHLRGIARDFQKNDFSTPEFVHGRTPAGVAAMIEQKDTISYRFEPIESGARVAIKARNEKAAAAVHEFLRFQIDEHRTH
jgi:hypothetical protein